MSTIYPAHDRTAWIIAQRPARAQVNPFEPYGCFIEQEPAADGRIVDSGGILLTNKECPWHCLMCDLWKHTLRDTVPLGAIPAQIDYALARWPVRPAQLKLYNSGSFFDPAAIPVLDYPAIAQRVSFAERVIVESHPRLIAEKALQLQDLLRGSLEVAMGLETVHPDILPRLNKRFTLEQFALSTAFLRRHQISVRAFVLVQPPFLQPRQAVEWAVKSTEFAFRSGVQVVSLIPTRPGNGALDRLMESGEFSPPSFATLERCFEQSLSLKAGRVFVDTWDLKRFATCPTCFAQRAQRLQAMNLCQRMLPPVSCACVT